MTARTCPATPTMCDTDLCPAACVVEQIAHETAPMVAGLDGEGSC